jgi:hypothetical protein
MDKESIIFLIGNKLPMVSEILSGIINYSPTFDCDKQRKAVASVLDAVYGTWEEFFPKSYLTHKNTVRFRIKAMLKDFHTNIMKKKKGSKRLLKKNYFEKYAGLFDILAIDPSKIEPEDLRAFYIDQKEERKMNLYDVSVDYLLFSDIFPEFLYSLDRTL